MPSENGNPYFQIEVQPNFLQGDDSDGWKSYPDDSFATLHHALEEVSDNDGWILFAPISVNPDYRQQVLELIRLAGSEGGYPALEKCKRELERFLNGEE